MSRRITGAAMLLGLISLSGPALAQQQGIRPVSSGTLFNVTPYAGYMIFGDFLRGPVGTTLARSNGAVYGAQLGMQIAPNVSVIGNVAHSSSDLQVGVPFLDKLNVGTSGVWLYDGGLQLDIPTGGSASPIKPFVQVGAGAIRYDITAASIVKTTATNFAFNAGAGLEYQMTPTVGFRLFARDYIGKFDVGEATSVDMDTRVVQNWALTAGFRVGF
jgi:opacity protein-like surface antigen